MTSDVEIAAPTANDPLLLEYDYFKHLSTIALVALGAILTSLQDKAGVRGNMLLAPITLMALSAVLSFSAMNVIINHRKTGKPLRRLFSFNRGIATATFATGFGLFMSELGKAAG